MNHGNVNVTTARALEELRRRIDQARIPETTIDNKINLATWNIREFGKKQRESIAIHLIAEIMNQFDLIAVTEVRDKLDDLELVMNILGPYWRVVFSDFNTDRRGNRERMAFVYDKRVVTFTGLAAEPDPPRKRDPESGESIPNITWWRSPYMASFRSGSFDFIVIAAHIRWDSSGGERSRKKELELLAEWIDQRRCEQGLIDKDLILLGDFNISDDELLAAIISKGLCIPTALKQAFNDGVGTNLSQSKRYDQILHYPYYTKCFTDNGGVLDFYRDSFAELFPGMDLDKTAATYQLSDHLPLWIQLDVDLETERLDQRLNQ